MSILKTKFRVAIKTYKEKGLIALTKKTCHFLIYCLSQPRLLWENFLWKLSRLKAIDDKIVTIIHGQKMYLNSNDFGISKELAIYHTHEPVATSLIKKSIKKGMTIVDIGANIGYYVLAESQLIGSEGRIIAIEPNKKNVELLKLTVKENNLKNIKIIEAAIGDYDRNGKLYLSNRASNCHSLISSYDKNKNEYQIVKVYKLDTLIKKLNIPVHLVRMDIEGYEAQAINGMSKILKKYKPILVIELHYDAIGIKAIIKLLGVLKQNGYDVMYISDRDKDFAWIKRNKVIAKPSMELLIEKGRFRVATAIFKIGAK